jgi:anhydro-N-acetylmuramic acid kinase
MTTRSMTVAGIMSGTSADGIDVAIVRITAGKLRPRLTLIAHHGIPYPAALRRAVLAAMNSAGAAQLAPRNRVRAGCECHAETESCRA